MTRYLVSPEVPGRLGAGSEINNDTHPPVVRRLHFVFDNWLGSHIVESFPCFLATREIITAMHSSGLTGFSDADAIIEFTEDASELLEDIPIPEFRWLQVSSDVGADLSITASAAAGCL